MHMWSGGRGGKEAAEALARHWTQGKPASRADSCEPAEISGHVIRAFRDQDLGHNCSGTSRGEIPGHARSTGGWMVHGAPKAQAGVSWSERAQPPSTTSKSTVALSVSISAIRSPGWISSPTLTRYLAMFPEVIVGESAGRPSTVCDG
jgi:hypothetical protein